MIHSERHPVSSVAKALDHIAPEWVGDLDLNPCGVRASCYLSTGVETAFVALTVHHLVKCLEEYGLGGEFQEVAFLPSRRSEIKGGFDLSIGHFQERSRVRTMHKLIYGKSQSSRFCDEEWVWRIRNGGRGDWLHLDRLVETYTNEYERRVFQPFLVLHVCFCLHEYRRMGQKVANVTIPAFDSPLRTIVVDLGCTVDELGSDSWRHLVRSPNFVLEVKKSVVQREPNESDEDHLVRLADPGLFVAYATDGNRRVDLDVLTFRQFFEERVVAVLDR